MISNSQLVAIFGEQHVLLDPALLGAHAQDLSFTTPIRPSCVVQPRRSEQIGALVTLANDTRTPLVPISSGPPHFRGDTIPGAGGAVIVDLSLMNKIIHIDRKNRVAMFEPGVTFGELSRAVGQKGLRLNMPLLPRASKSVVGSLLEREPVIMPKYHWDIADPLACTEVFFGNGERFRTGAAAGSGSIEEQWAAGGAQKEAAGPSAASWYRIIQGAQGTMGIVTWVSARCELSPTLQAPYFIAGDHLDKLLDTIHWLIRLRLVNECLIVNLANLQLAIHGDDAGHRPGQPLWALFFNLAAYELLPEERLQGQIADMFDVTQRLGVEPTATVGGVSAGQFLGAVQQPADDPYWKLRKKGACQDIFFLTTLDKVPAMVAAMLAMVDESGHSRHDLGVYIQPIVQGVNCHCEFNLFFDPHRPAEVERTRALNRSAVVRLSDRGAFFSRPYGESARLILNRDAESVAVLKKIKEIVDPGNIMNPGKLCF